MAMVDEPDPARVHERSRERDRDRTDSVETIIERAESVLDEAKYPTTSEELAAEYADEPIDLPNETESLGSVFDRLVDERFETPEEAREALHGAITGPAGGAEEYNAERELDELDGAAAEDVTDSGASDM